MDILSTSGINNLINNYTYSEKVRRVEPLQTRKTKFSDLSSAWSTLDTKLNSFKNLLSDFKETSSNTVFGTRKVNLSTDEYFEASATTAAVNSSYDVFVEQLAKSDLVMSNTVTSSTSAGLSAGDYTFRVASGEFDEQITVTIDGTETFEDLMKLIEEEINNTATGSEVSASVFSPSTDQSKLSIVASESGSDNAIIIEDVSGNLLSSIGLDLSSQRTLISGDNGGYSHSLSDLDAKLQFNGIDITRGSNTINDLISGVTLKLKEEMAQGVPTVNVTVATDIEDIQSNIEEFVDKFNEAYSYVKENYNTTEDGYRGVFVGNSSALNIIQKFSQISTAQVQGLPDGELSYLSDIGLEFDVQNGLKISDKETLQDALANSPNQVEAIFNSENGIANQLYDVVDSYVSTNGIIDNMVDSYDDTIGFLADKITKQEEQIDKNALVLRRQYEDMQVQLMALYENQSYFNMFGIY